ncbi:hypothetical protein KL925_001866 [Ogataea polymorpha]|nr:hypothetical protein KL925_001866 [Ogataea polymorpha]
MAGAKYQQEKADQRQQRHHQPQRFMYKHDNKKYRKKTWTRGVRIFGEGKNLRSTSGERGSMGRPAYHHLPLQPKAAERGWSPRVQKVSSPFFLLLRKQRGDGLRYPYKYSRVSLCTTTDSAMSNSDAFSHDIEKQTSIDALQSKHKPSTASAFRHDDQNIYINDQPIDKNDFIYAFGGSLNVGARKQTGKTRELSDPVPAGLAAFSCSALSLGLVQLHARSVHTPNVLLGAFLTTAGLVEIIVGVLCFIIGNTWACCTFLMFGGFWSSYSFLLMDVGGIAASYATTDEYNQAVALYFLPWALFSFALFACTWRSTYSLSLLMFLIWLFILLFTIGQFATSVGTFKAGGYICMLSGIVGFYNMFAGLLDETNSYFTIKPFYMPNAVRPGKTK